MEGLVAEGLVRSLGIQDASVEALSEVLGYAAIPPAVHSLVVHPGNRNDALVAFCRCQVRRAGASAAHVQGMSGMFGHCVTLPGQFGVPRRSSLLHFAASAWQHRHAKSPYCHLYMMRRSD